MTATMTTPVLLELDNESWKLQLDRVEPWLNHTLMLQSYFVKLTADTRDKVEEPHVKEYLQNINVKAQEHLQKVDDLFRLIGRDPSRFREASGTLMAKAGETLAAIEGFSGGAVGSWRDLQQVLMASLHAIGAFGVAQQLGLALGLQEFTDITLEVSNEKYVHHFLLQEVVLDLAALSILYQTNV